MKIFFHTSTLGKSRFLSEYQMIIKIIKDLKHTIISDHVMKKDPEYFQNLREDKHKKIFLKRRKEIKKSDAVITEITQGSVGVGHLISLALEASKSVLVLSQQKPHGLLLGNPNRLLVGKQYSTKTPKDIKRLKQTIKTFLKRARQRILKKRFNLLINEEQKNYLELVSKNQGISKADFIRQLINKSIDKKEV